MAQEPPPPTKREMKDELQRAENVERTASANLTVPTRVRLALLNSANRIWRFLARK